MYAMRRWDAIGILAVAAAWASAMTPATADTELTFFAAAYTPEITSGDNPHPLHEFTRIAREWEALHPGVKVRFIKQPIGDYLTWMLTQLKGGTAPDIMWAEGNWCVDYARNGWFVRLNEYLDAPNPYVPGNRRWRDVFHERWTWLKLTPDGGLYSLPIDLSETAVYYNKDIFAQAGVAPPTTWAEFMTVCERLKQAGYLPFAMGARQYLAMSWIKWALHDQLWSDRFDAVDVKGDIPRIDDQEMVRAYKTGLWSPRDPRYTEMLRLLKDWSQYWNKDALAHSVNDERLFRTGKAAMLLHGSWYLPQLTRDPLRTFDFGVFATPGLTPDSSPYAPDIVGPAPGVGGSGATQFAITESAVRGGKVDLAVDFMRFFTAPERLGALVMEGEVSVPNGPGIPVNPLLQPFVETLDARHIVFQGELTEKRSAEREYRVLHGFLGGRYTLDEAVAGIDASMRDGVAALLKANSQWRFSPAWDILPDAPTPPESAKETPLGLRVTWTLLGIVAACALLLAVSYAWIHRRRIWRQRMLYVFILPTMAMILVFSYYPVLSAFYHSLFDWGASGESQWVGLSNFREVFRDPILAEGTGNLLQLLLLGMVISITAPLAAAEFIFHLDSKRAQYIYRVLFIVPMIVPGVVSLLIWGFIFDYHSGLLNQFLRSVGLEGMEQAWLGDPRIALYSLIFMGFPWVGGFALLIYTAGLQNIPQEVLDSSRLDGATGLRRFWHIDLPLVAGQIKLMIVLGIIGGIQGFQTQLLLTDGGPGYSTTVPGLVLYQNSMLYDRMGYACAIGVVLFVVILGLTYINMRYLRSSVEYEAG